MIREVSLERLNDEHDSSISVEKPDVGFSIKRFYFVYGTILGVSRWFRAHRLLQQAIVPVSGQCRFVLDNGAERVSVMLKGPTKLLFIDPVVGHEMHDFR